jgi:succinyl-diaminopimelate desuccinylase
MKESSKKIIPGYYRHFKGNEYEVLYLGKHSETLENMVIYRALYGGYGIWVRPESMFNEEIIRNGKKIKRFEYIEKRNEGKMQYQLDDIDFLNDLKGLLKIESTNGDAGKITLEAPLGEGINQAINYMMDCGQRFGFKTKNIDGYCGYIEMGEGKEMMGILTHLDTVPVGDDWSVPPFDLTRDGDKIYGRGVLDDKGLSMIVLYAMKAVSDLGIKLNKRVRLILGGDEEGGHWKGIARYKKTEEEPSYSFSPDSGFPVVFAEKGILRICIQKKIEDISEVMDFYCGTQINTVPDYAKVTIENNFYEKYGKAAHASEPEKGVNAMILLANEIREKGIKHPFLELMRLATKDGFNINLSDEISGGLTLNPSIARVDEKHVMLDCDIRYPVTMTAKLIKEKIEKVLEPLGFSIKIIENLDPMLVDQSSFLVRALQQVYQDYTGEKTKPVAIGGGTYARAFKEAVAFGGRLPEDVNTCHQKDEYWSFQSMKKNYDIIINAIKILGE